MFDTTFSPRSLQESLSGPSYVSSKPRSTLQGSVRSGPSTDGNILPEGPDEDLRMTMIDVDHNNGSLQLGSPVRKAEHISHLPTPQSPSNFGAYVDSLSYNDNSPVGTSSRGPRLPAMMMHRSSMLDRLETPSSLMTPESSPLFAKRPKSSIASSPPSTPPRNKTSNQSLENLTSARYRPTFQTTPSPSLHPSTPSVLSSPFVDRSERHTPSKSHSRNSSRSPVGSTAAGVEEMFVPLKTPPPLPAPIPQRAVGGEITRIRLQIAAEQAALQEETESRRPEYLKRAKRPLSELEDEGDLGDQENTVPALGVMDSPVKGRRLALFQATSEESFEQSLLAGGYPSYGITPAYGEPTTPQASGKSGLSQRAVDWIHQATPGQPPPPPPSSSEDKDCAPTEHDLRKRRRLDAFKDHNVPETPKKLHAVEVEGCGRVLQDQPHEDLSAQQVETPTKKRNVRRKRGGTQDSPSRRKMQLPDVVEEADTSRPNWPDQVFPWSMRVHEREDLAQREEEQKLVWIERYLERESDEDDGEDQSLGLPATDAVDQTLKRGRGKMIPLPENPVEPRETTGNRRSKYYPTDPADARAALLSKRSVRALAFRRQQEENEVVCICRGKDDGRELVQCDDCKEWFHLQCIGVTDIEELGQEDDPWYCMDCLGIAPVQSSSPTFVPTEDRPASRSQRDPLFFQTASQESPPGVSWNTSRVPRTPIRGGQVAHQLSSRSSWDESSSSQAGPRTPSTAHRGPRVYETPKVHVPHDDQFDPSSTPSRGIQFSGPFTTPKPAAFWSSRASAMQTPSRPAKKPTAPWMFDIPREEPSSYRPVYDDSPVRRSQPRPDKYIAARRVQESPLAARSTSIPFLGRPRSPLAAKPSIDRTQSRSALA